MPSRYVDAVAEALGARRLGGALIIACARHFTLTLRIDDRNYTLTHEHLLLEHSEGECELLMSAGEQRFWTLGGEQRDFSCAA